MARTKSPLLSAEAHGKLARSLIFSKRKTGQLARSMHYPKKEPSLKQWTRRHIVGLLTAHWQCMTVAEHNTWNANAQSSGVKLPGYQYFLKLAQADLYTHHGLVAYWSLNEKTGNTIYDYSGNSLHGTLFPSYPSNCPSRVSSFKKEYGNALLFDGVDDYCSFNHNDKFNITSQLTIEFWIKMSSLTSGVGCVFHRWLTIPSHRCYLIRVSNEFLRFNYSEDGQDHELIVATIPLTLEWTHAAFVFGLDGITRLFINSVQDSPTGTLTSLHTFDQSCYLGVLEDSNFLDAALDEVRIYNRALSYNEIKKHYELLRLNKKRQPLLRL